MTSNVPLGEQVNYMLIDMKRANNKKQCNDIYLNYMNLYRNEYPKANRAFTTAYAFYVSIQDYK